MHWPDPWPSVINIFDPEVIVLGGGMSNIGELYAELPGEIRKYVFSDQAEYPHSARPLW